MISFFKSISGERNEEKITRKIIRKRNIKNINDGKKLFVFRSCFSYISLFSLLNFKFEPSDKQPFSQQLLKVE